VTWRCETEGEIEDSRSNISPSSMFTSCNRLRCGRTGRVSGRFGVDNTSPPLSKETRERSVIEGNRMEGSSWSEEQDEAMERDEREMAFDRKMSETIAAVVGSRQSTGLLCGGVCNASIVLCGPLPDGSLSERKR
jgi:hypothetical protein